MLNQISWQQYFVFVLVGSLVYYLFIWVFVFKASLTLIPNLSGLKISLQAEDGPDEVITTAQHVIDELRPLFTRNANKNELIYSLQLKLAKYKDWEEPGFRETIFQFILNESQTKCSIRLGEEDQRALW